jgi:hypothetical protein
MRTKRADCPFQVGDLVQPRPEWCSQGSADPDPLPLVPSGRVRTVVSWGHCGVVYVDGDRRGFIAEVFEHRIGQQRGLVA